MSESWASLAVSLALAAYGLTPTDAHAAAPCGPPPLAAASVVPLPDELSEDDRLAVSAAMHLTVGAAAAATKNNPGVAACQVASFEAEGMVWQIHTRTRPNLAYHVTSSERPDSFMVTQGVNLEDARAWAGSPSPAAQLIRPAAYYLVAKANDASDLFFLRIYAAAPGSKQVADDVEAAMSGRLHPFGAYNGEGQAASVLLPTATGIQAQLYQLNALSGPANAYLYGPDGTFFQGVAGGAMKLRGSQEVCPAAVGQFELTVMSILEPGDVGLDLGCRYDVEDSRISMFVSHIPDAQDDRKRFAAATRAMQQESGVKRATPGFRPLRNGMIRSGQTWIDQDGVGQGLWFTRRGAYVIEIRATFETSLSDDVFDLVATVAQERPAPGAEPR
ncbi:hypothetical protein [Phenylobacterium sp.]|uniref:hypothetical protein n=1 Tax=Phenylobacterium sp. TaxID=1871053 RepID=UPI003D27F9BE